VLSSQPNQTLVEMNKKLCADWFEVEENTPNKQETPVLPSVDD